MLGGSITEPFFGESQPEAHEQPVFVKSKNSLVMAPWKNVDLIVPGLYLGKWVLIIYFSEFNLSSDHHHSFSLHTATDSTRYLTEHRITHIISVCTNAVPAQVPGSRFHHMRIPVQDLVYEDLLQYMRPACDFIDAALKNGGNVLVHSEHGKSRSAAIVAAYSEIIFSRDARLSVNHSCDFIAITVMRKNKISAVEACALIREGVHV